MSKAKSRSFSIYLLKLGYDASNALKGDHTLDNEVVASKLPAGASLFVLDSAPRGCNRFFSATVARFI